MRPAHARPAAFRFHPAAILLLLLASALTAGWWTWRAPAPAIMQSGACRGCNFLLITIDTLRSDRVEAFGGAAGLMPVLNRLAAEGVRLTRTYSPAPLTLPSHASIMTAVSPPVHGVRANGLFRLGVALPTLATVLETAGYRTGAFVGAFVLDARFGLNRGFGVYDDRYDETNGAIDSAERRAEDVIKPAAAWILARGSTPSTSSGQARSPRAERQNARPESVDQPSRDALPRSAEASAKAEGRARPWFAWVHLYDPHDPYRAPQPYNSRHSPYDAEVAYADAMVGKLIAELQAAGQLDRTVVMVAADHGESLGEHGEPTHGVFAYEVTQRVPWIVWAGSHIGRGASDALVRLIDLAPTALDLLGVEPPREFEGRSVVPVVAGAEPRARIAYLEAMDANLTRNWAPLTAVVNGSYKLIDLPVLELYDVAKDPRETSNLVHGEPDRVRDLMVLVNDTARTLARRGSGSERAPLGAEATRRLQALGYVASSAGGTRRAYRPEDDPKALMPVVAELNRAIEQFDKGDRAGTVGSVMAIIQSHPRFSTAYTELARMQRSSGNLPAAVATLENAARQGVANQRMMTVLAGYLAESHQLDKAMNILQAVVAEHPDDVEALNSLGVVASRRGDHALARTTLKKVVELDPTSARAYANLAADALATGELDAAVPDLRRAIELDPRAYDALFNLGMALWELGQRSEAAPLLERFAREAPPRYAQDIAHVRGLLEKKEK